MFTNEDIEINDTIEVSKCFMCNEGVIKISGASEKNTTIEMYLASVSASPL